MGSAEELKSAERAILTVDEVVKILAISRNSIYRGIQAGEIPHVRIGRRKLIPRVALEQMLERAGEAR